MKTLCIHIALTILSNQVQFYIGRLRARGGNAAGGNAAGSNLKIKITILRYDPYSLSSFSEICSTAR